MSTEQIFPYGWDKDLQQTLDFESAYNALSTYDHFHSFTLKGMLRQFQMRPTDALDDFEQAEQRYPLFENTGENRTRYSYLLGLCVGNSMLLEAMSGTPEAAIRTDEAFERFRSWNADTVSAVRNRDRAMAVYALVRGRYGAALDAFQRVIYEHRKMPERLTTSYIGAAAAAHELGLYKKSRRHYENAELTLSFYCNRLFFALHLTWVLALCRNWGWHREAARWEETIRVLECPESTREALFARARAQQASRTGNKLVFV